MYPFFPVFQECLKGLSLNGCFCNIEFYSKYNIIIIIYNFGIFPGAILHSTHAILSLVDYLNNYLQNIQLTYGVFLDI